MDSSFKVQKNEKQKVEIKDQFLYNANSLLNKGLNFCPTPKEINTTQLYADMLRMERQFACKHFFKTKTIEPKEYKKGL